jgi:hypothetical protein
MKSLLVIAVVAAAVSAEVFAVGQKQSIPNHEPRELVLSSTGAAPGEKVVYRITRGLFSVPGTPNSLAGVGTLEAPAAWKEDEVLPLRYSRVSSEIFAQPGDTYGASALKTVDIYPQYGDLPGAWVCQSGATNYVRLQFPAVKTATAVKIFETFNPGGVYRVKVHSLNDETEVVYEEGGTNVNRETLPNGASVLTITFDALTYVLRGVTVFVDASQQWRGIDAVKVVGLVAEPVEVPGDLFSNVVTILPFPEKSYGCDAFTFQVHDGKGGPWSNPAQVLTCYGCPKNPKTGAICSGVGKCNMAECVCQAGFKGDACEESNCARAGGKICGGNGSCNSGVCKCFRDWTGEACTRPRRVKRCATCNDPHYTSFDNAVFSFYETGETLAYTWRKAGGPPLVVAQHLRNCGSNAYMEPWSPISCVDGISVRYGDDVVTWLCTATSGRAAGQYVNCGAVGALPGVWQNIGTNGMMVQFNGGGGMVVKISDTFYISVNCGCYELLTSIPTTEAYSNEIVGMCGNNDNIRSNDLWGAKDWVGVPQFPTEAMSKIPAANYNVIKRQRAIAWGEFFMPTKNCDLLSCKKCGSYLNYNQFPISYAGNLNLAMAEKVAHEKVMAEIKNRVAPKTSNPAALKLLTSLTQARVNIEEIKGGRVGIDGDVIPNGVKVEDLPDHLVGCPYEVLYAAMDMKTCMQWIGSTAFDTCVWDACALASKAGGLTASEAVVKATELNQEKVAAKKKALSEMNVMVKEEKADEKKQEQAAH